MRTTQTSKEKKIDIKAVYQDANTYLDSTSATDEKILAFAETYQQLSIPQKERIFQHNNACEIVTTIAEALNNTENTEAKAVAVLIVKELNQKIEKIIINLINYANQPDQTLNSEIFSAIQAWYNSSEYNKNYIDNIRVNDTNFKTAFKQAKNIHDINIITETVAQAKTQLKDNHNTAGALKLMRKAQKMIDELPREVRFSSSFSGRNTLHQAYLLLAGLFENMDAATQEDREQLRINAGHAYFGAIRTMANVEPFDHFSLIKKYKRDLPRSGICNAFTSEAIRFYEKKKVRNETDTFINKMSSKLFAEEKPLSFLQRMSILQEHDVSSTDATRKKGLPAFDACNGALGKDHSIEILMNLGFGTIKHSILIRLTPDNKKPTGIQLIDSSIGQVNFPNTENGIKDFNETMKLLERAYVTMYGQVQHVLIQKEKSLISNPALLFKSTDDKQSPDMTFKDKVKNNKKFEVNATEINATEINASPTNSLNNT